MICLRRLCIGPAVTLFWFVWCLHLADARCFTVQNIRSFIFSSYVHMTFGRILNCVFCSHRQFVISVIICQRISRGSVGNIECCSFAGLHWRSIVSFMHHLSRHFCSCDTVFCIVVFRRTLPRCIFKRFLDHSSLLFVHVKGIVI